MFYFCSSLRRIFVTLQLRYLLFNVVTFFDNIRITLYVSFLLVIVTYFLLGNNCVIYLFVVVTFFDDVRITLLELF